MDVQDLLKETMDSLREAIVKQAQQTANIEKEVIRLQAQFEASCVDKGKITTSIERIVRELEKVTARCESIAENHDKLSAIVTDHKKTTEQLSSGVSNMLGKSAIIAAIALAALAALLNYIVSKP